MKVAIIKYNAGNIYSVVHALNRLGHPSTSSTGVGYMYRNAVIVCL